MLTLTAAALTLLGSRALQRAVVSPCRLSSSPESGSAAGLVNQLRARCSEALRIVRWLGRLVHDSRTDFMFTLDQERTSFNFILISYLYFLVHANRFSLHANVQNFDYNLKQLRVISTAQVAGIHKLSQSSLRADGTRQQACPGIPCR